MTLYDHKFTAVLSDYNERLKEEDKIVHDPEVLKTVDVNTLLIPVGEEVGRLMHSLVVGLDAKIIVELGTSYGYSTLFLADAARATGGKVYSYDVAAKKQAYAREQLERAELADFVEFRLGDAVETLSSQPGPVDFVLMDLWKDLYIPCLEKLAPMLGASGTILADNMTFPLQARKDALAYQAAVRAIPGMQATLLPIGNGIDIAVRQAFEGAN
jgi:predicted O-methyltransferase YrrM